MKKAVNRLKIPYIPRRRIVEPAQDHPQGPFPMHKVSSNAYKIESEQNEYIGEAKKYINVK